MGNGQFRHDGDDVSRYVGVIGILCAAVTKEHVIRKTRTGPLWPAVCNRWHGHGGRHWMTDAKFVRLWEWGDDACAVPDWKAVKRAEMALARKAARP